MTTIEEVRKNHPATWSPAVLLQVRALIAQEQVRVGHEIYVLDPFCGPSADLLVMPNVTVTGIDIEPEWAITAGTADVICGDSRYLKKLVGRRRFHVGASSATYANRMSDHHEALEVCSKCQGAGLIERAATPDEVDEGFELGVHFSDCAACDGKGKRDHTRVTYRHRLGRPLTDGNSGGMPWGAAYKSLHEEVWRSMLGVMVDDGLAIVNVSNSMKLGEVRKVVEWHLSTLFDLGTMLVAAYPIRTRRMGYGAHREKRVEYEHVLVVRKV